MIKHFFLYFPQYLFEFCYFVLIFNFHFLIFNKKYYLCAVFLQI